MQASVYILSAAVFLLLWWLMSSSSSSCSTEVTISSHRYRPPLQKKDRHPLHEHKTRLIHDLHAHIPPHVQTGPLNTTITRHADGRILLHTKGVDFDKLTKCDLVNRETVIKQHIPHASQMVHGRGSVWTSILRLGFHELGGDIASGVKWVGKVLTPSKTEDKAVDKDSKATLNTMSKHPEAFIRQGEAFGAIGEV